MKTFFALFIVFLTSCDSDPYGKVVHIGEDKNGMLPVTIIVKPESHKVCYYKIYQNGIETFYKEIAANKDFKLNVVTKSYELSTIFSTETLCNMKVQKEFTFCSLLHNTTRAKIKYAFGVKD